MSLSLDHDKARAVLSQLEEEKLRRAKQGLLTDDATRDAMLGSEWMTWIRELNMAPRLSSPAAPVEEKVISFEREAPKARARRTTTDPGEAYR